MSSIDHLCMQPSSVPEITTTCVTLVVTLWFSSTVTHDLGSLLVGNFGLADAVSIGMLVFSANAFVDVIINVQCPSAKDKATDAIANLRRCAQKWHLSGVGLSATLCKHEKRARCRGHRKLTSDSARMHVCRRSRFGKALKKVVA